MFILILFFIGIASSQEAVEGYDPLAYAEAMSNGFTPGEDCKELAPGNSIDVDTTGKSDPLLPDRQYTLYRDKQNPKVFTVELPITFLSDLAAIEESLGRTTVNTLSPNDRPAMQNLIPAKRYAQMIARTETRAKFINLVRQCYASMKGKLKSPDGTEIQLRLDTSSTSNVWPIDVTIQPKDYRSNLANWESDADCAVIIHESLHKTGLVDGYPEPGITCRHLTEEDNVMSNHLKALQSTYELNVCVSPGYTQKNVPSKKLGINDGISCPIPPPGSPLKLSNRGGFTLNELMTTRTQILKEHPTAVIFYKEIPPPAFALTNGQTRFITQPRCLTSNHKYTTCARDTSRKSDCGTPAPYCKNGDYLK